MARATKNKKHTTKGLRPPKNHSSSHAAKIYWPYLPLFILLIGGMFLNVWQPMHSQNSATLAYATEVGRNNLLTSTNSQRSSYGQSNLSLNSELNAAAQAKANDMVAKNYWSHKTPDGRDPWVFIDAQGYIYEKAGENLAYGFGTSDETIIGWMNSPSHKANLLDGAFSEVGFGFANSEDFVKTGNETIVVAMYGKPSYVAPAVSQSQEKPSNNKPQTKDAHVDRPPAQEVTVAEQAPIVESPIAEIDDTVVRYDEPVNTDEAITEDQNANQQRITLFQELTKGKFVIGTLIISLFGFALSLAWLAKHFVAVRKYTQQGEYFIAHHPVLDLVVIAIVAATIYLTQGAGVVL